MPKIQTSLNALATSLIGAGTLGKFKQNLNPTNNEATGIYNSFLAGANQGQRARLIERSQMAQEIVKETQEAINFQKQNFQALLEQHKGNKEQLEKDKALNQEVNKTIEKSATKKLVEASKRKYEKKEVNNGK